MVGAVHTIVHLVWTEKVVFKPSFLNSLFPFFFFSGAGKTTFLNALSGRTAPNLIVQGTLKINSTVVSPHDIKKISAYVQQQDLFFATLTVREHLTFQVSAG